MSYYILPKTNNILLIDPKTSAEPSQPITSISFYHYYNENKDIIDDICSNDSELSSNTFFDITKLTNPYEYIYSKVPGSQFSVSKLKPKSNILYELIEIFNALNLYDIFKQDQMMFLHIGLNCDDSYESIGLLREGDYTDNHYSYMEINNDVYKMIYNTKFDFMMYEVDTRIVDNLNLYSLHLIKFIMIVLRNQSADGSCIIKLDSSVHKPIIDIFYLMSSMYEKVYIIKPTTSNVMTYEKYLICKRFLTDDKRQEHNRVNCCNLFQFLRNFTRNKNIVSLFDDNIPALFMNKLDDSNIIIGQQQLEALDNEITILKSKNRNDKIDMIKKTNIQKSVGWCEKHNIPCNKFTEKTNMFLPLEL